MPKLYDIAILGATAAGYAAAYRLAGDGASVVVVDAPVAGEAMPLRVCHDVIVGDAFGIGMDTGKVFMEGVVD